MADETLLAQLRTTKQFFDKSTACLAEDDSEFAPADGMMTAAQQVAHTAQTVDWFIDGAFRNSTGLDTDFEAHQAEVAKVTSLAAAREWLEKAFANAIRIVETQPDDVLNAPMAGQIMGGFPRRSVVGGIVEHTAHHRGALTVYARLRGKTPEMPYA